VILGERSRTWQTRVWGSDDGVCLLTTVSSIRRCASGRVNLYECHVIQGHSIQGLR
jgi:hypothetical protein